MYRELDRSTSGTERAVSNSVLDMRSRDSSRTEESRSVIFTKLFETVAVDKAGPPLLLLLLLLEKMELETAVKVGLLEATEVGGWEDTVGARQG